jgi:hypothetical protein
MKKQSIKNEDLKFPNPHLFSYTKKSFSRTSKWLIRFACLKVLSPEYSTVSFYTKTFCRELYEESFDKKFKSEH